MSNEIHISLRGVQEAQDMNARAIAALRPAGAAGVAVRDATAEMHRYAVSITHVWKYKGGGLKTSHRMEVNDFRGRIYIDPGVINPRGQRPVEYGPHEHARGGSHAFYARTMAEVGPAAGAAAVEFLLREVEGS